MKWLFKKDGMGVEGFLYVLLWFFATLTIVLYALDALALIFRW